MTARRSTVALTALCALLAGCSTGVDKSGAPAVTTLTVGYADTTAGADGQSPAGPAFLAELRRLSAGRLDVVERGNLGQSRPDKDVVTARAIATGEIDVGWVATRAMSDVGIRGFDALAAPMVLTSDAAVDAMVDPAAARPFLDRLAGSGLTGLALAAGVLRRPVSSADPLLGADDWKGMRVGVLADSQKAAFTDLGAMPTTVGTTLQSGFGKEYTAAELDLGSYDSSLLSKVAPYVSSNVVLWPKMWVLVANETRLAQLTEEERGWVAQAARTAAVASTEAERDENALALRACDAGARFPAATQADVAGLRTAFAPTLARLAADPVDGPLLSDVTLVAAEHPGVDALALPARCATGVPPVVGVGTIPTTRSQIPPGTYRMTLTEKDLLAAGVQPGRAADNDLVITMTLAPDGTYKVVGDDIDPVSAAFTNLLWEVGTYTGKGSRIYFIPDVDKQRKLKAQGINAAVDEPGTNLNESPVSMTWTSSDDSLTFSDVAGMSDPIGVLWNIAHPYRRIG